MYPSRLTKCRLVLEAPPLDMVVSQGLLVRKCARLSERYGRHPDKYVRCPLFESRTGILIILILPSPRYIEEGGTTLAVGGSKDRPTNNFFVICS